MSIVVLGSINLDLTTYVPNLPAPGETLFGREYITVPGGKGFNQAVAAGRLGAETKFIGRIGRDAFGEEVMASIAAEPIDTSGIFTDPDSRTGLAVISVDDTAENAIIVVSGANIAHDEREVARCREALATAEVLLLQRETPLATSMAAAEAARAQNITVIFDPAPAGDVPDDFFRLAHIMTPNESETKLLTGIRPTNADQAAEAAERLHWQGLEIAVIKMGAKGLFYSAPPKAEFLPAFDVETIDTVAAGDAFNGGLAVALSEGRPLEEAMRWGAAAGALATTKRGASSSMPTRDELMTLLN